MKHRLQISLTEAQLDDLRFMAKKSGESVANVIRRAVERFRRDTEQSPLAPADTPGP